MNVFFPLVAGVTRLEFIQVAGDASGQRGSESASAHADTGEVTRGKASVGERRPNGVAYGVVCGSVERMPNRVGH